MMVYNLFAAEGAPPPEKEYHFFLSGYFAVQSAFLLGSVYFPRFAFIKTVVAIVLFMLGFVLFQRVFIYPLLPKGWNYDVLRWSQQMYDLEPPQREMRLPRDFENILVRVVQFGVPPFFWFVTYIRLKEKEI
jgi:hypothetical protein